MKLLKPKKTKYDVLLEMVDDRLITLNVELDTAATGSERYGAILKDIRALSETREVLQSSAAKRDGMKVNKNTLITAGVSLASVLLILKYEKLDIITSKALGLATKGIGR